MLKFTLALLILSIHFCYSQPYYTRFRGAIGAEAYGISPKGQVYAETAFGYKARSFWDVQAGLGMVKGTNFGSYSLSAALTYSYLLNPYRRRSCHPAPGYNSFESYLEGGAAAFFVDPYQGNSYLSDQYKQKFLTPLALAGFRFHVVTEKLIYIAKVRYTPALVESKLASQGGFAFAIGWR